MKIISNKLYNDLIFAKEQNNSLKDELKLARDLKSILEGLSLHSAQFLKSDSITFGNGGLTFSSVHFPDNVLVYIDY